VLAKQVRAYIEYADRPIQVHERGREVTRTFLFCLLHPSFDPVDDAALENGYFQLLTFPDFQLLHNFIRTYHQQAGQFDVDWASAKYLLEEALERLSNLQVSRGQVGADVSRVVQSVTVPLTRDPLTAGRYVVIAQALSKNRKTPAIDICKLFDFHYIPLPKHWQHLKNWVDAYRHPDYTKNVQKLITTHKGKLPRFF